LVQYVEVEGLEPVVQRHVDRERRQLHTHEVRGRGPQHEPQVGPGQGHQGQGSGRHHGQRRADPHQEEEGVVLLDHPVHDLERPEEVSVRQAMDPRHHDHGECEHESGRE
jgi:hypothetical protein